MEWLKDWDGGNLCKNLLKKRGKLKIILNSIIYRINNETGVNKVSNSIGVKICFEGQHHQMDLDTLILSLLHFSELVKSASEETMPGEKVQIKIDATEKGSFEVLLELFSEVPQGLLSYVTWDNIEKLTWVMALVVGFLEIKRFLKGKKPDNVQSNNGVTIITYGNSTIHIPDKVYSFYKGNQKANEHVENLFDKLVERPEIEGLTIESENQYVSVKSEEFAAMSQKNELVQEIEEIKIIRADVSVLKVVFQRNRKWEFIYQGNKISAEIVDDEFWNKINVLGLRFGKGDILTVDLEITQIFDYDANAYLNKSYRVLKVLGYRQAPRQIQLDLTDE